MLAPDAEDGVAAGLRVVDRQVTRTRTRRVYRVTQANVGEQHVRCNDRTFNTALKAVVASRGFTWAQVQDVVAKMSIAGVAPDSHTYFQLLLACNKLHMPDEAERQFDALLAAGVEPIQRLCGVLSSAIGDHRFEAYRASRARAFEEATRRAQSSKHHKGDA